MRQNIPTIIKESCERFAGRPALASDDCILTYADLWSRVCALAAGLRELGVNPGDKVVLLAQNHPWWGVSYLATLAAGAVIVPVLPDFPAADVHHVIRETDPRVIIVSSDLADRINDLDIDEHEVPRVIMLPAPGVICPDGWLDAAELIEGRAPLPPQASDGDDDASIIYTSGTSGHSKGVVLSHHNLIANARAATMVINLDTPCRFLSLLPLAHAYEFTIGFLLPLMTGSSVYYPGIMPTPALLKKICAKVKPEIICMVPLIMEKIYRKRIKAKIEAHRAFHLGRYLPPLKKMVIRRAGERLLDFLGGRIRVLAIGGAALDRETEGFLRAARLPFICGYGLSEASPLVAAGPFGNRTPIGSVGRPIPGVEVKIRKTSPGDETGVVLARGPNIFKGYFRRDDLTAEIKGPEGWLDTGDLGFIDEQGCLHLTGRAKNVIVLANGENVYPEIIESRFAASSLAAEVLVVDRDGEIEALIHPDYDYIDQNLPAMGERGLREKLDQLRLEINRQLPASARVKRVHERREPFLKTATHKIKRYLYTE